ncbi:TIGR02391 family protein [Nocardioides sp. NPDC057767]
MLTADGLHPSIWRTASAFWETGQRAAAVEYGAKSLTAHIQQKSGSKLADRELAADVFSPKPHKAHSRLWLPGDRGNDTWRSRQDVVHDLAMGA